MSVLCSLMLVQSSALHLLIYKVNLGVWFDRELKFDKQINNVVKLCFFNLRLLAKVKPFLSAIDLEKLIHAFIFSRLDYCNTIYIGVNQTALARLQAVQNAAARLLTGTRKHEHITPILFSLKWLPVRFRIEYKLLVFVFKSLNGLAPTYLDALVKRHTSARSLRSSDQQLLTIPRARLKLKGDRAFSVAAPKLWNLLPVSIRSAQTISSFKLLLKTYLLTQAFNLSECWVLCSLCLFVCVVLCLCLCIFMKMFFVCCCFLWLFGFLFLYSTLGNNGCIILCYRNKWKKKIYKPISPKQFYPGTIYCKT